MTGRSAAGLMLLVVYATLSACSDISEAQIVPVTATKALAQSMTPVIESTPTQPISRPTALSLATETPAATAQEPVVVTATTTPGVETTGEFRLVDFKLKLTFEPGAWNFARTEIGRGSLKHKLIVPCEIVDFGPSEINGQLLNTVMLGATKYEIWGWANQERGTRNRTYLAVNIGDDTSSAIPSIAVTLPYDNSEDCAMEVSKVLATLSVLSAP